MNEKINTERLSDEVLSFIEYMENEFSSKYPTVHIDSNFFVFGMLISNSGDVCNHIEAFCGKENLKKVVDAFHALISSKTLSAVKPGRKIIFDDDVIECINKSYELLSDDEQVECFDLLSSFVLNTSDKKIKDVFNCIGLSENFIKDYYSDDDNYVNVIINEINASEEKIEDKKVIKPFFKNIFTLSEPEMQTTQKTGFIEKYCTNINDLVDRDLVDDVIDRASEVNNIIRTLGRRRKNSVILVGADGIGKTSIAESLAIKIKKNEVPEFLSGKELVSLNVSSLLAGTSLRGMMEERVIGLINELKNSKKYILLIDNINTIIADKSKSDVDISSIISSSISDGSIQVIGTCGFSGYRRAIEKDSSFSRNFKKIVINEPTTESAINMLKGIRESYEKFHKVVYSDEIIENCVILAKKYISERNLPDSAIDIMDEAGAMISIDSTPNSEVMTAKNKVDELKSLIDDAKKRKDYDTVDTLSKEYVLARVNYNKAKADSSNANRETYYHITLEDILTTVSDKTGIPITQLTSDDKKTLVGINDRLKECVIGQDDAIDTICKSLKRNRIGLHKHGCMFSFMSIGPSGVGKTLIAKKLAKEIFGREDAIVRFDMSEYHEKSAVSKLIGSNPGYIGYEDGGLLTETIKNNKYCVLLLDEIEKADPDVYNIFLQVLDEGFLTDNSGMKVDFSNVIVMFTSNVGAKAASDFGKGIGFTNNENENTKRILDKELKKRFPPEFLNRIDNIVHFNSLNNDNLKKIIKIELKKLCDKLEELKYSLSYDENVVDFVLDIISDDKEFGARPIIRAIQDNIEDKITDLLLENNYKEGYMFNITCTEDNCIIAQ